MLHRPVRLDGLRCVDAPQSDACGLSGTIGDGDIHCVAINHICDTGLDVVVPGHVGGALFGSILPGGKRLAGR